MVRRLRNVFAHSSGFCDQSDSEHLKLRKKLVSKFKLKDSDHLPSLFPIPVDQAVVPLAEGSKQYVQGKQ